jgi:hypothetical protein
VRTAEIPLPFTILWVTELDKEEEKKKLEGEEEKLEGE